MAAVLSKCSVVVAVAGSLTLAACKDGPTYPSRVWTADIHGTVVDPNFSRIPNATVAIYSIYPGYGTERQGSCVGSIQRSLYTVADQNGDYSVQWRGTAHPDLVCLSVDAIGSQGGQPQAGHAEVDSIVLGPTGLFDLQILVKTRRVGAQ